MTVPCAPGSFGGYNLSSENSQATASKAVWGKQVQRTLRILCYSVIVFVSICTSAMAADTLNISEFRLRGPNGANDEFVEIYNYGDSSVTVATSDGSSGYALAASNGVARFVIPNGTVIPAGGHYLGVNSVGYSLASYPAGNGTTATGDATFTSDIPDNAGIALFKTSSATNFNLANRLDAVGSTSEANSLYKEGNGYSALTPFSIDYSFVRDSCGNGGAINPATPCNRSTPKDTDSNSVDFIFVDTNGTSAGAGQRLGAPGPQNLTSPIRNSKLISYAALDVCAQISSPPNRVRDFTSDPVNNSTFGTLDIRRTFTNKTGTPLTRLRFNVISLATFPAPAGIADLRPRTSTGVVTTVDRPPCGSGTSNVTVQGTVLEQPPSQPNGGGFNSTFSAGTVTLGAPLAAGASIDLRFLFGIQQTGNYRVAISIESLPGGGAEWIVEGNTETAGEIEGGGLSNVVAGNLVISEFRLRGPNGANDEFVEIYNTLTTPIEVVATDGSGGFALAASDGVARFVIPNGTIIPGRGHYLGVNAVGYSLASYPAGSGATATGDATYTSDIADNAGVALFKSANPNSFNLANRLDAVGSISEANTLYKEGSGYPSLLAFSIDYSFVRDECGNGGVINTAIPCTSSTPKDTDSNAADFIFVDSNGTSAGAGQRLGAAGPENLSSPIRGSRQIAYTALDSCAAVSATPNRLRDFTSDPANNSTFGTLDLRRTFTNNTGTPLTRLRFTIINLTTFPAAFGTADLRPRTSTDAVVTVDRPPCGSGTSNVTVRGTTLEQPPSQPNGGGFNSTFSAGTVTLGTPLAAGSSIDLRFLFGIQQTGTYRIAINIESSPEGGALWTMEGNTESSIDIEGISVPANAGDLIISEFRLRGPNGASDEFVEIHNTMPTTAEVFAADGSSGYALATSSGTRFVIPNGTIIPSRGHYLGVNSSGYSLASYPAGSGATATGDATYTTDIADNAGIALFKTTSATSFNLANRLDAVGSTAEANSLYKEGNGYSALTPFSIDYSFVRDECGNGGVINTAIPCTRSTPKDTDSNAADFIFVDSNGTSAGAGQRLGAAGPENLSSPPAGNGLLSLSLLDSSVSESSAPNAVRSFTSDPANNSTFGTVAYRLRVTNNTDVPVTRLRFRVIDLTTFPAPSGVSDLRPRSSNSLVVGGINDPATCSPSATPCSVTVQGTTLEQPPSQPNGGGFNSTFTAETVTPATPLTAGTSVNVQLLNGLQQTGCTRLGVVAEALPGGSSDFIMLQGGNADIGKCITAITGSYAGGSGSISCIRFPTYNSSSTCTMTAENGWYLSSLTDNGIDVLSSAFYSNGQWSYTINNVTTDHDVQSGFTEYQARRNYNGVGFEYADTIAGAYKSPLSSDFAIELRELIFTETVSLDQPYTILLSGGWSSNFGSNSGAFSTINGGLAIKAGRTQVHNIKVR